MQNYKVIIAGGRHFNDYELLKERCDYYLQGVLHTHNVIIISGHATGADSLGERYAKEKGLECDTHPADWNRYGKSAGYRRNAEMAASSDALIAFWNGESLGTKHMINLAEKHHLQVEIISY